MSLKKKENQYMSFQKKKGKIVICLYQKKEKGKPEYVFPKLKIKKGKSIYTIF